MKMNRRLRHHRFAIIPFLILAISSTSIFQAQGRKLHRTTTDFSSTTEKEEKMIWRGQIGSRPPRCERRCRGCGHCEAIQVPTNPKINRKSTTDRDGGGGDDSNYKPLSWKCKCGNLIFNP